MITITNKRSPKLLLLLLFTLISFISLNEGSIVVNLQNGAVQGFSQNGVDQFLGIPFAEPPVGDLRFQVPQASSDWKGVLQATSFRNSCMQVSSPFFPPPYDEDCLYLNVFAPSSSSNSSASLPVMVWIFGGGYISGGASYYNGEGFVNSSLQSGNQVVLVTISYRLGPFGFFPLPSLVNDLGDVNFGLLDQNLALRWVQNNIASFGGDPSQVTIFGESAGGGSVLVHLTWDESWPLFNRAALESPAVETFKSATSNASDEGPALVARLSDQLGCSSSMQVDQLECLRAIDQNVFVNPTNAPLFNLFLPVINDVAGGSVPAATLRLFDQGKFKRDTSILIGTNSHEGDIFSFMMVGAFEMNETQFDAILTSSGLPVIALDILKEIYRPLIEEQGYWVAYSHMTADFAIVCPSVIIANAIANSGSSLQQVDAEFASSSQVWRYLYTHKPEGQGPFPYSVLNCTHGDELPFIFPGSLQFTLTQAEVELSNQMIALWTNFAINGDPNGANAPQVTWPPFRPGNNSAIVLDLQTTLTYDLLDASYCEELDPLLRLS